MENGWVSGARLVKFYKVSMREILCNVVALKRKVRLVENDREGILSLSFYLSFFVSFMEICFVVCIVELIQNGLTDLNVDFTVEVVISMCIYEND